MMIEQKKDSARILVFGNEKGGSGKSTSAMHVAIALVRLGYKVASIDLDARQGTFTRYLKNRFDRVMRTGMDLPAPSHMAIERSSAATLDEQQREEREFLEMALAETRPYFDFVVIDTPGTDSYLSRMAHSYADILVTPMNDSFVDLDLLTRIEGNGESETMEPSVYTKMVAEQRRIRKERDGGEIDWIVMRNRLAHLSANNKMSIGQIVEKIGKLYGFRVAPGFCERVIFKELFLKGITLLDLQEGTKNLTMSQLSARQEVRQLILAMGLLPKRKVA